MTQSILLRGARQVLTLRGKPGVRRGPDSGKLEIIEDGSVFIQDGKIACVGSTRRLENLKETRGAMNVSAHDFIVMPGFVDPCIHLSLSQPSEAPKRAPKRRKLIDCFNETLELMRSCLMHGTLNAAVTARGGTGSLGADLSLLRQLSRINRSPVTFSRMWHPDVQREDSPKARALAKLIELVRKHKLAESAFLECDLEQSISQSIQKSGLPMSLNWRGGRTETLQALLDTTSPIGVFCKLDLSEETRKVLAKANAAAVFDAGSFLLDNYPGECVRALIEDGGAVALGSGYDADFEPNFNMQMVLALAVRRLGLTIEQAIVATTINAAFAVNRGTEIGSLEPGKRAEVLVLNLTDYRDLPRRLGVNHVAMVIRDGQMVLNRTSLKVGAA